MYLILNKWKLDNKQTGTTTLGLTLSLSCTYAEGPLITW